MSGPNQYVLDRASNKKTSNACRRLIWIFLAFVLASGIWTQAVGLWLVVLGFLLSREAIRLIPETTGESILVIVMLALGTACVLSGPWVGMPPEERGEWSFVQLPHCELLGASSGTSFFAWLLVVTCGAVLTFRYETVWVQAAVLLFALLPQLALAIYASALVNA
jgi:hypothetical protein